MVTAITDGVTTIRTLWEKEEDGVGGLEKEAKASVREE